jgi:DNA-binding SARP family transcriptional activator
VLVPELRALVSEYPLREQFARQLMVALYRSDRAADALAVCRALRSALRVELGLDVGPEVRRLERAILRQEEAIIS